MDLSDIEAILWDFDGVLLNSNHIRDLGFELTLKDYPNDEVKILMDFHKKNGGLSRYVKFRYFFEEIRKEKITEEAIFELASIFSKVMMQHLCNEDLIIKETVSFVKSNALLVPMYIVSGSDQYELRQLCQFFRIETFFQGIYGSPTPKKSLVESIIGTRHYDPTKCVLVGDSINDYEAALNNGIHFMAYNNKFLKDKTSFEIPLTKL